ncbi:MULTISPECIES: helix-turn-helix transcriptional regulator [Streptomyces]|uniref:Transcriptional regulator n=1 Tax=Streptomyces pseudogriseolus TaxID=36817 RepID=A0ABQ2TBI9_STREZ|nr:MULTISPECIES: helix-turn-helix transcriptional regulator [Streptomyces]MCI4143316.1 helix-turn-helix transcriptional regulator [Streptomyces sp. MMS20-AI2-20]GGQ11222.1 transcriptional regulator [Streptomyces gancidicus]GGS59686.1 transcriptional regulator [Streptomyces rubiginosus]
MPPTNNPTLRQRRLGAELRKLREKAGFTVTRAAEHLGVNQGRVSMIETGRSPVSADLVRRMASAYDCPDKALVDALAAMTRRRRRGWWEEYREHLPAALVDLAELEHHTPELRVALVIHIPALLQTTDHARALFRAVVPAMRQHEIEHRLTYRIKRQGILHREDPPAYSAIIHEAALRMGFGGPSVSHRQLTHLLDMGEMHHVTIQVVPFGTAHFPSTGQSFDYLTGAVPQLDTVQLDTHHGGCGFLDAEAQLTKYRAVLDHMASCALGPTESRDFIHRLIREA